MKKKKEGMRNLKNVYGMLNLLFTILKLLFKKHQKVKIKN